MGEILSEEVPEALVGERLDRVVAMIAEISRSAAVALIANSGVRVDGEVVVVGKGRLRLGQTVSVDQSLIPRAALPGPDPSVRFDVVYADESVVVIDKPAGLVVHPGAGRPDGTLVNGLLAKYPEIATVGQVHRPGIVHRLDSGTSGLLIVARRQEAYDALVAMMSERQVHRHYVALVWGHLEAPRGTIDAPLGRDPRSPLRMAVVATGKEARTRYEERHRYTEPPVTLVDCELETGRTHQIRVHLQAIGHPVVGDAVYGGARASLRADRPFLHADRLELEHPIDGRRLEFSSPLPRDLAILLESCH